MPIKWRRLSGFTAGAARRFPNIEKPWYCCVCRYCRGIKINFKPSERQLEDTFKFGMDFGKAVLAKKQDVSKTKWRCLVCGHIHTGEEPPEVCPACGVGRENFVKEALEEEFSHNSNDTYIVIGGGAAGLSAVQAIRKRDEAAGDHVQRGKVRPYFVRLCWTD
jgi:rubredoxin